MPALWKGALSCSPQRTSQNQAIQLSLPIAGNTSRCGGVASAFSILYISLNPDLFVCLQKRRAPKNDEDWSEKCGEISHMRPIQARKLKLIKVTFWQLTAAATAASQELSTSGKAPGPSRAGIKYPVRESLTSTNTCKYLTLLTFWPGNYSVYLELFICILTWDGRYLHFKTGVLLENSIQISPA